MLCENCKKKEATVFYEENINGKKKSYRLCAECAAEKGVSIPDFGREMLSFGNELFGGILNAATAFPRGMSLLGRTPEREKRCPVCGSTLADITRNGRLGCGECYSVFGGMPLPKPKRQAEQPLNETSENKDNMRSRLEDDLRKAVAAENFEEAARIRDILRGEKRSGEEDK